MQSRPGSHGYGLQAGPLLDIHDHAVARVSGGRLSAAPAEPGDRHRRPGAHPGPPSGGGENAAAEQILPLLREWIIPRVLRLPETLRAAYGAWFKAAFDDLLRDQPELRRELRRITYIEEAEAVMHTFGTIIAAKEREGEARGLELGEARGLELGEARGLELGKKEILVQFVAEFWDDDEAARFAAATGPRGPRPLPHDRRPDAGPGRGTASPACGRTVAPLPARRGLIRVGTPAHLPALSS